MDDQGDVVVERGRGVVDEGGTNRKGNDIATSLAPMSLSEASRGSCGVVSKVVIEARRAKTARNQMTSEKIT